MRDFTSHRFMDQTTANPFLDDVFVDHPANLPGVGKIHHQVFSRVLEAVESRLNDNGLSSPAKAMGRVFLITAPEAGYGKSHLVARLRDHLGTIASTVVLPFDRSRPAAWPVALSSVLRQLSMINRSRNPVVSLMDEVSRFFLSRLVLDVLASGSVKERDCPEGAEKMRADFASLFAQDSNSKILTWVDKRSADLARLANPDFSRNLGMGQAELSFWTRVFVDLNLREESALERLRGLSSGEARERLLQLLRITTDYRPVMLVADGLDGFFASETAGMDITEIINGIRERVPRSVTLVCLNEDVWTSVFENHIPSAWLHRLTGETSRLHSISPDAAGDLVLSRLKRTSMSESAARGFSQKLSDVHHWGDAATHLSPRVVIRQANDLWRQEAGAFLNQSREEDDFAAIAKEPLSNLTDKADFFTALQNDRPAPVAISSPPPLPAVPQLPLPAANPFFVTPDKTRETELAGIDSIINDIRGSGKTVVSESPEIRIGEDIDMRNAPHLDVAATPFRDFQSAASGGKNGTKAESPVSFAGTPNFSSSAPTPVREAETLTRATLEQLLARREQDLLSGPALSLDLERLERFIRTVGAQHAALGQQEERYPSSRTVCLRWNVRGQSVLTGFESPRNVYFWNNLLQQSLASNRQEKIAAFSHHSEPFDPSLFSSFGFGPAVIRGKVDIIEMNDRELAMIYAADRTVRDLENTPDGEKAIQLITLHLDPLWRRMIQAV
ncbi:MAG: hypothetical protein KA152_01660 [Verrucomicrobiales bacterium]|jgi:hypothetical protein|nr:hypothetical protein [Verrucomicrobiales bacterium]